MEVIRFDDLFSIGAQSNTVLEDPEAESIFTLCFTSGTTGNSKAAKLSHRQRISGMGNLRDFYRLLNEDDTHLSFLPLGHVADRGASWEIIVSGG